jgi:hypothetical protein
MPMHALRLLYHHKDTYAISRLDIWEKRVRRERRVAEVEGEREGCVMFSCPPV